MPLPPPPPPPSGTKAASSLSSRRSGPDRGALFKSIQQGARLKKTVTNDRSAPIIGGSKSSNTGVGGTTSIGSGGGSHPPGPAAMAGFGNIFANGIPTLKKTSNGVKTGRKPDEKPQPTKNNLRHTFGRTIEKEGVSNNFDPASISYTYISIKITMKFSVHKYYDLHK